jgi:hypothetical protein
MQCGTPFGGGDEEVDNMNTSVPAAPGSPIYFGDLTEAELLPYFQSQYPGNAEGCGPFSIAMAANLCNRYHEASNYRGAEVQAILEKKGLKIPGYGMPTWWGVARALDEFAQGQAEHKSGGSIADLAQAISNNQIVVVALAWQTTWEILSDIRHATVGHYMVTVGFDQPGGRLIFLNPGLQPDEGSAHLYPMTFQDFDKNWNGTSNLFVQAGSMWTISP